MCDRITSCGYVTLLATISRAPAAHGWAGLSASGATDRRRASSTLNARRGELDDDVRDAREGGRSRCTDPDPLLERDAPSASNVPR